ncbi:MAG: hypothetical protein V1792_05285 [Pseudomonadota bacterium]
MRQRVSIEVMLTHVRKRYGLEPEVLADCGSKRNCSEALAITSLPVWYEDDLSLTNLSMRLGSDLCSLSEAVNRQGNRVETNPRLAARLERVREDPARIHICEVCPYTT